MARSTYTLGSITFRSKKAVIEYVQKNILYHYDEHSDLSTDHFRFMLDLLANHPDADLKVGLGVCRIWVQSNSMYPTKGFWLERIDGTKTDFSFYQCLQPDSKLKNFKVACRAAVARVMIEFRHQWFKDHPGPVFCPVSGQVITQYESHVDHAQPWTFERIVQEFIAVEKIDVNTVSLTDRTDGLLGCFFTDEAFSKKWVAFHNERAKLRVVSAQANLRLPREKVTKP